MKDAALIIRAATFSSFPPPILPFRLLSQRLRPPPTLASDRRKPRGGHGSWAGACVILCPDSRSPHRRQQLVRGGGSGVLDCKFLIRERALCDFVRVSTYIPHDLCVCLIYTPFHGWRRRDLEGHKECSVRERAGVRGSAHACLDFFTRPPL